MVEALDAVHLVLDLGPGGADAELQPAAGQVVDGDRELGQDDGVAVGVAGDQAADAHALGRLGHRRLQRPALVDGPVGAGGPDRGEVVEVPQVVETALVGDPPHRAELIDGDVLTGGFQAEAKRMRHRFPLSESAAGGRGWGAGTSPRTPAASNRSL